MHNKQPSKKQSTTDCATIIKDQATMPSTVQTIHEQMEESTTTFHVARPNPSEQVEYNIELDSYECKDKTMFVKHSLKKNIGKPR